MFNKFALLLALATLITGCAQAPKVHVYARYLNDDQIQTLSQQLRDADFQVEVNSHRFPDAIQGSSIVYSPLLRDPNQAERLRQLVEILGWEVDTIQPFSSGNHWFKKNNLGLFLVPDSVTNVGKSARDIASRYKSHECEQRQILELIVDGHYRLTDLSNGELIGEGQWRMRQYPYVELTSSYGYWSHYFVIAESLEQDQVSEINMTTLSPVQRYPDFTSCQFAIGVRRL